MTEPTATTGTVFPEARMSEADRDRLRGKHYNATITSIRAHNPDLWVMRVRPDAPPEPFIPGQYTTLGLGYWEPRVDDVSEDFHEHPELLEKVVVVGSARSRHYIPLTTREPENEGNKIYIQDLVRSGGLETELESPLDPATTHVYLCGPRDDRPTGMGRRGEHGLPGDARDV